MQLIKPANHLVPLNERETIVLHFEGMFRPDTLSVCSATRIEGKMFWYDFISRIRNLTFQLLC